MTEIKAPEVKPEKTVEEKQREQLVYLETQIELRDNNLFQLTDKNAELLNKNEDLFQALAGAQASEKSLLGAAKIDRQTIKDLKTRLEADPNLQELERLRIEVSSLHRQIDGWVKYRAEVELEVKQIKASKQVLDQRLLQVASTMETMQKARDAAQARESAAYAKLALAELAVSLAEERQNDAAKRAFDCDSKVDALTEIHVAGHPEAIAGCKLCAALGRVVTAVPVGEVKPS